MLALLVERSLEVRLAAAGIKMTAEACLGALEPVRLNLHERHELLDSLYTVTRITDADRQAVVAALNLVPFTRDREVADRIRPR